MDDGKEISRKFVQEIHKSRWNGVSYKEVYEKNLRNTLEKCLYVMLEMLFMNCSGQCEKLL